MVVHETQAAFVRHLAHWLPAFFARIRTADPGPVFAAAVDLLEGVVHDDSTRLSTTFSKPVATSADR